MPSTRLMISGRLIKQMALVTTSRPVSLDIPCRSGERQDPHPCDTVFLYSLSAGWQAPKSQTLFCSYVISLQHRPVARLYCSRTVTFLCHRPIERDLALFVLCGMSSLNNNSSFIHPYCMIQVKRDIDCRITSFTLAKANWSARMSEGNYAHRISLKKT